MTERAEDMQVEALRAFLFLQTLHADWRGRLAVSCSLSTVGAAFSIAANLAGAGCLIIEPRSDMARAALRLAACDFLVNSVDEALRILKNEIRKHQPVSVAVAMAEAAALDELADRGVAPEVFTAFASNAAAGESLAQRVAAAQIFQQTGAVIPDFDGSLAGVVAVLVEQRLQDVMRERGFVVAAFMFGSAEELRAFDTKLMDALPEGDVRRRWCLGAPRFFHRERPYRRVAALTAEERVLVTQ